MRTLLLSSFLLLAACSDAPNETTDQPVDPDPSVDQSAADEPADQEADPAALEGDWRLAELRRDGSAVGLWPAADITLQVNGRDVGGNAACNSWGGQIDFLDDGSMRIGDLFWTEMACEPPLMDAEQQFLEVLTTAASWRLDGDRLTLTGDAGELDLARDARPDDAALGAVDWRLNGIIVGGDAVSFAPDMNDVVLRFGTNSILVSAPCWTLSVDATIEPGGEGNMRIDAFANEPKRRCEQHPHLDTMLDVLDRTDSYLVFENNLRLNADGIDIAHFMAG